MIAMLAADREKKIGELVLMSASGSTGADLILAQQTRALDRMKLPDAEKAQEDRAAEADPERRGHAATGGTSCRRTFASRPTRRGSAAC